MMRTITSSLLLSLCAVGLSAADVWIAGPSHTVGRTETPEKVRPEKSAEPLFDQAKNAIRLYAARNEFVSFQIVYGKEAKGVKVEPLVLKGPKGTLPTAEAFRALFLDCPVLSQYDAANPVPDAVKIDAEFKKKGMPRQFTSPLIPLTAKKHGAPFDVVKGQNEVVWMDLFVPESASPGEYTGELKTAGQTFKVTLTVWNFALPTVSHFPIFVYTGPEEIAWGFGKNHRLLATELKEVFASYFDMARNHRVCLLEEWQAGDPSYVKEVRKYWDHQTGQAFKGPFGAGMGYELLELSGENPYPWEELKAQGWLNRAFAFVPPDEPGDANAYEEVRNNGKRLAEQTKGQLRRMVTEQAVPSDASWGSLDPGVDIYCSGSTPISMIPELERRGKTVWTYNAGHAGGPYIDAPAVACRTHSWAGFLSGARAWFFWDGCYVVDKQFKWKAQRRSIYGAADPSPYVTDVYTVALNFDETLRNNGTYNPQWAIRLNGDGLLFYPGKEVGIDGPVACVRLKNLRQGGSDFEYLYLLEKAGQKALAEKEARVLLGVTTDGQGKSKDGQQQGAERFNDYQINGDLWDAARIRLGQALDKIGDTKLRSVINPYNQYPNPVGHPDFYSGRRY
jgi:hypothetical protein